MGGNSNRLEQNNFLMYGVLHGYLLQTGQPTFSCIFFYKKSWKMDPGFYGYLSGEDHWSSGLSE